MAELAIAGLALFVSLLSFIVSLAAYRLAREQEARKRPFLIPSLVDSYVQFCKAEGFRIYGFLLSVRNPSDANNSLAEMKLHITYRTTKEAQITVQLPSSPSGDALANVSHFTILATPARIEAHQTLTGWSIFRASEAILKDATIEGYEVALIDSHGTKSAVEPIMIRELR